MRAQPFPTTQARFPEEPASGHELRHLNIRELACVYDALILAREAMLGVVSRPKVSADAAEIIDTEIERIATMAGVVADRLATLRPDADDEYEVTDFARVVLDWNVVQCGDGNQAVMLAAARRVITLNAKQAA